MTAKVLKGASIVFNGFKGGDVVGLWGAMQTISTEWETCAHTCAVSFTESSTAMSNEVFEPWNYPVSTPVSTPKVELTIGEGAKVDHAKGAIQSYLLECEAKKKLQELTKRRNDFFEVGIKEAGVKAVFDEFRDQAIEQRKCEVLDQEKITKNVENDISSDFQQFRCYEPSQNMKLFSWEKYYDASKYAVWTDFTDGYLNYDEKVDRQTSVVASTTSQLAGYKELYTQTEWHQLITVANQYDEKFFLKAKAALSYSPSKHCSDFEYLMALYSSLLQVSWGLYPPDITCTSPRKLSR